jgi:hypothetical protein
VRYRRCMLYNFYESQTGFQRLGRYWSLVFRTFWVSWLLINWLGGARIVDLTRGVEIVDTTDKARERKDDVLCSGLTCEDSFGITNES